MILIAEDNHNIRWVYEEVCQALSIPCLAVRSGRAALDAFLAAPGKYKLLITDGDMPFGDGFWLARQIHKTKGSLGGVIPPILLISGTLALVASDEASLFTAQLEKPCSPQMLKALIQKYYFLAGI